MLSKIGEAFSHSEDVSVSIEVTDNTTGVSVSDVYYCESGNLHDVLDGIENLANQISEQVSYEFNN